MATCWASPTHSCTSWKRPASSDAPTSGGTVHLPPTVDIREVGLRDGLQLEAPVPTEAKLQILDAVAATGVSRVEVTSFVSPRAVPAMADAEQVVGELGRWPDVHFSALVAGVGGARRAFPAGGAPLVFFFFSFCPSLQT